MISYLCILSCQFQRCKILNYAGSFFYSYLVCYSYVIPLATSAALIIGILIVVIIVLSVVVIKGRKPHHGHQCSCQGTYISKFFHAALMLSFQLTWVVPLYRAWWRHWNKTKWSLWTSWSWVYEFQLVTSPPITNYKIGQKKCYYSQGNSAR